MANSARERYCLLFAIGAGITVVLIGVLVLLGWALDIPILKSLLPGYAAMKPLTAFALSFAEWRWCSMQPGQPVLRGCLPGPLAAPIAAAGAVISLASIVEYALHSGRYRRIAVSPNAAGNSHPEFGTNGTGHRRRAARYRARARRS